MGSGPNSKAIYCMLSHALIACFKSHEGLETSKEADPEEERGGVESSGSSIKVKSINKITF